MYRRATNAARQANDMALSRLARSRRASRDGSNLGLTASDGVGAVGSRNGDEMDNRLFDDWAKRVATGTSRRGAIKGLIGGALGIALGSAASSASAQSGATPVASCVSDSDCGNDTICCDNQCQAIVCCDSDPNDTHCGPNEFCDGGVCFAKQGSCAADSDCDPCYNCVSGSCEWQCGTGLGATCDGSSGTHGTCRFDCRACEGDACCTDGQSCNRDTGACYTPETCGSASDCDACSACTNGVCVTSCGPCQRCDSSSGACVHDCRARDNCCASDHTCDQSNGTCQPDQSQYGTLVIKKVDKQGAALPGACFDLINNQTGAVLTSQPHCDGGFGDNGADDGTVIFSNNVRGIFRVRETIAPTGYTAAADQVTPNIDAGQTVTITFVDDPIPGQPTATEAASGGEAAGEGTSGGTVALPNTGVGERDGGGFWLAGGAALLGGAAALVGGLRLRKPRPDA